MCGIAGILHRDRLGDARVRVRRMANSIRHRGPDDEGFWSDGDIALGFRRLAIVDLETGRQPMPNEDGTVQVVFNGEIYNHRDLRRQLEAAGHRFATDHSDTEVLVHGYEEWGTELLPRLNGMFAFVVWDQRRRRLLMARDRLGIKPVYFAESSGGTLLFASEVRALHASGLVKPEPDNRGVLEYFMQQSLWGERTMFRRVRALEAGNLLIDETGGRQIERYWDFSFSRKLAEPRVAAEALRVTLEGVVASQMAADVPVLSYLSGGIDSTAITAIAQKTDPAMRAYSCIFDLAGVGDDATVDERAFSRAAAAHLGIARVELQLPQDALRSSLHATIAALEEPRMGMAYVNYLIASRVAADGKVVLSGCGGDEILGGYVGRYAHVRRPDPQPRWVRVAKRLGHGLLDARPRPLPSGVGRQRMLELYGFPVPEVSVQQAFLPAFREAAGPYSPATEVDRLLEQCPSDHDWDRLAYVDAKTYLAGLLVVEDKLSMAHSLEARVPLIDNELIDLSTSFDWPLLCDGETGKIVFREAIRDIVPPIIADKPKMGFGPPDASWYRGALQPFVRSLLSPKRIAARGVLDPSFVSAAVDEHMEGRANRLSLIWSLMSFDAWCEIHGFYGGDLGDPLSP